jgi:hypothetical protein
MNILKMYSKEKKCDINNESNLHIANGTNKLRKLQDGVVWSNYARDTFVAI